MVVRPVAQAAAVIELRRAHDLARIEQAGRIEAVLHLLECLDQPIAEHRRVKLGAHDAVAVLARMRAFVFAHERERLLGDGTHRFHVLLEPQVEYRPHMQAADRSVRIPGAAGAVLFEHVGKPRRIVGEIFERHRTVLDEGNRLSLLLHRHHDIEAGGAHVG